MPICIRPGSPILRKKNAMTDEVYLEDGKIHRVVPRITAICQLAHIDSPNCIWFKLCNHISAELQLCKPAKLKALERPPDKYDYVLAPLEEGVYARARVIHVQLVSKTLFAYVHFIDEGYGAWLFAKSLAKMGDKMFDHPWQAFPVSLFKLDKAKNYSASKHQQQMAEEDVRAALARIMGEYELFKVIPAEERSRNDYGEYTRAQIYGLESAEDSEREHGSAQSIGHRLALQLMPFDMLDRSMFNVLQQPLPTPEEVKPLETDDQIVEVLKEMPRWRQAFPVDFASPPAHPGQQKQQQRLKQMAHQNSWDSDEGGYKAMWPVLVTEQSLRSQCSIDGGTSVVMCLDWNSLKSPFEFYAYPLRQKTSSRNSSSVGVVGIKQLLSQQAELTAQLNTFYGVPENRRPVEPSRVGWLLQKEGPLFAVCETGTAADGVNGANNANNGAEPSFRRVQVLTLREVQALEDTGTGNQFCRVRYLDHGGTEVVPMAALLQIHSSHCKVPPLCIQVCLESISPPPGSIGGKWQKEDVQFFKSLIRVDVPLQCGPLRQIVPYDAIVPFRSPAHRWPGVFGAIKLRRLEEEGGGTRTVDKAMVKRGRASDTNCN